MSTMQSFGWATLHDEPMLFPTRGEALQHCDEEEEPIELVSKDDALAAIKAARGKALEEAAKVCDGLTIALDNSGASYHRPATADRCATAIRRLGEQDRMPHEGCSGKD